MTEVRRELSKKGCDSTSSVHCRRGHLVLLSYGMHRLTTYHRSKLSTWRNQLSIFISITSRCNSLSLHCWCGMNWFICHLLVKKFNFDVGRVYFFTNDFFTTQSGVLSCGPFSLWIVNVREEIIVNCRGFNSTVTSVSEGLWTDGGFFILPAIFYFLSPPFFALLTYQPSPPFLSSPVFPYLPVEFKALTKTSGKWRENLNTL